jgi:hypothetical protein
MSIALMIALDWLRIPFGVVFLCQEIYEGDSIPESG